MKQMVYCKFIYICSRYKLIFRICPLVDESKSGMKRLSFIYKSLMPKPFQSCVNIKMVKYTYEVQDSTKPGMCVFISGNSHFIVILEFFVEAKNT